MALANSSPVLLQRWPTWVPVLPSPLKKRMPVMVPGTRERNLTPNSTPFASGAGFTSGNDGGDFQMLVGATVLPVVNDQVTGLIALFDTSRAPLIVAVYAALKARPEPE